MTPTFHRAQTRQLINAAGGPQMSAEILGLADTSAISRWQNGNGTMSTWHLGTLQCALGVSSYSDALSNLVGPPPVSPLGMIESAAEASRHAGALPAMVLSAKADGRVDESERRMLLACIRSAKEQLDRTEQALLCEDTSRLASVRTAAE